MRRPVGWPNRPQPYLSAGTKRLRHRNRAGVAGVARREFTLVEGDGNQVVLQSTGQGPVSGVRKQDRLATGAEQGP